MAENEDRRVRKTKKLMSDALAELLTQKPLSAITVKEIAELADINRGTFYLHYRDIYDMARRLQDEMIEKFDRIVESHTHAENADELFPLLTELFGFLNENAELARVMVGKNGDAAFLDKLKSIVREKCLADIRTMLNVKSTDELDYFYEYTVSGCIGVCHEWLVGGRREDPSQMAALVERIILDGAQGLKNQD